MKKFYITTAIAYPNSRPHLGHALEITQADAAARFYKLSGKDVFLQTGTDEHGLKNWQTAKKAGKDIMGFLDENVSVFRDLFARLKISYDNFLRTSDKEIHYPAAQELWNKLVKSGDIYKRKYSGLYCTGCEAFKTEKELENGRCPNHSTRKIETVEEENYFFRLSKYRDKVSEIIERDEYKVVPQSRKNEILSFLKIAEDISFSRPKATLPWGIPVPGDDKQVMYVWCDALSNYITGVYYGRDNKKFKEFWPADMHMIGKDILRFHAAFWPAMLISAGIPLPKRLFVHGFILSEGTKMSKSTGNVIEPFEQIEKYGPDAFRYCLLQSMPMDGDGEYSEKSVKERINTELVANIGNFCYRVLSFLASRYDSKFSKIDDDKKIISEILDIAGAIKLDYDSLNFRNAIQNILRISSIGNKYFQDNEPWKLINADREKTEKVIGTCINIVKILTITLKPMMPDFSAGMESQLGLKDLRWKDINFELKKHKIGKPAIIFHKCEESIAVSAKEFPLNIKAARIDSVKEHPNAEKLYVLDVDIGKEKRQIVAGLREHYSAEELKGKKIVVVCNLKHAKLRGIESQGMLLAGDDGKSIGLLTTKAIPGTAVLPDGLTGNEKEISFDDFMNIQIIIKDRKPYADGMLLKAGKEEVLAERVKDGARVR
ncbi:methionine--tRNA ligase [Candidatus Woesearchaeota archaeon]|nr:methionine--tRNA ligase [Candidatus Woesearchaeota archaeon]